MWTRRVARAAGSPRCLAARCGRASLTSRACWRAVRSEDVGERKTTKRARKAPTNGSSGSGAQADGDDGDAAMEKEGRERGNGDLGAGYTYPVKQMQFLSKLQVRSPRHTVGGAGSAVPGDAGRRVRQC